MMAFQHVLLDRASASPLYEQLRDQLAGAIRAGVLPSGTRLPSTRVAASTLDVNRATVVEAYRRLESEGLVAQRPGSGTYVLGGGTPRREPGSAPGTAGPGSRFSRAALELDRALAASHPQAPADAVDFSAIAPHERGFPADELAACLASVLSGRGADALGYGPPAGDVRLREVLAERLRGRGLAVEASGIVVVAGAQQGLDLLFRATLDPGDLVATESPTYHLALELLRFHRAEPLPLHLEWGAPGWSRLSPAEIEDVIGRRRPKVAYLMPTFQNPTGLTLDAETRARLVAACASSGSLLVEDDYEADMRHEGAPLPPLAALPGAGPVLYVGTLSKALFPGLRVGWIAGDPALVARLVQVKRVTDLSGSTLLQAAAAELIAAGTYDRHLAEAVAANSLRMRTLVQALGECLPAGCRASAPHGGHALWVELPPGVSGRGVAEAAAEAGVLVSAGEPFLPRPAQRSGLRLSVARASREDIPQGARRLARAIETVIERTPGRARHEAMETPVRI